jgi:pentose-5-phosphate-3-epimerase
LLGDRAVDVSIDGGVKVEHARPLAAHGARRSWWPAPAVFQAADPATVIRDMRTAADAR